MSGVGVVSFYIIQNLSNHHCIIGWDLLHLFGVEITSTTLIWSNKSLDLVPYSASDNFNIEVNDLQTVLKR